MSAHSISRIIAVLLFIILSTTCVDARRHKGDTTARVKFLAASTLIRGTWGQNEDTYLAELNLRSESESILVRLIDEYPNLLPPISYPALTSATGTKLRVRRDSQCDTVYGRMLLRAKPGDLTAILPERLVYHPVLERRVTSDALLLCYRTVR